jgi:hypothetical protein
METQIGTNTAEDTQEYFKNLPEKIFDYMAKKYGIDVEEEDAKEIVKSVEITVPGVEIRGIEETTNGKFTIALITDNENRTHVAIGTVKRRDENHWWSCLARFNGGLSGEMDMVAYHDLTHVSMYRNENEVGRMERDRSWEDYLALALFSQSIAAVIKAEQ